MRCLAALLAALVPLAALAQDDSGRAKWEIGVAAGGGRVSDYPGSSQSHARGLVVPVVIYRGPRLRVDQRGIRGRLFDSPDFEFDVAASAAFDAHDNDARQGMAGLDYLFGIGPQIVYKGLHGVPGAPTLHLKLRALFSSDFRGFDGRGAALDPEVRWRFSPLASIPDSSLTVALQPTWASRSLHRYFYEVRSDEAIVGRPAYRARAGYFGTEFNVTFSRRLDHDLSWFVGARSMSLHGAANHSSPLLRRDWSLSVGGGVVWTPWRSEARAAD